MRARVSAWQQTPRGRERARANKRNYTKTKHGIEKRIAYARLPHVRERTRLRGRRRYKTVEGRYRMFNAWLQRRYKLSAEDWARMFNEQSCRCAVCERPLPANPLRREVHLDHNHETGKVRGILCHPCNALLGFAREDQAVLKRACEYLERHRCVV